MWAVLDKYGASVGVAHSLEEILRMCFIEWKMELVESENPEYPLNMHAVATKKYVKGTWFEQKYIMKDDRTARAWTDGFTVEAVRQRILQDIIEKLKKTYTILPVDTRQHRTVGE